MVYRIKHTGEEIQEIRLSEIDESNSVNFGIISTKEALDACKMLNIDEKHMREFTNPEGEFQSIDVFEGYSMGCLNIVNEDDILKKRDHVCFIAKRNIFLMIDVEDWDKTVWDKFEKAVRKYHPSEITLEKMIYELLYGFIENDSALLEKLENNMEEMENLISRNDFYKNYGDRLWEDKKKVFVLKSYYKQLSDIGNTLLENTNKIFGDRDSDKEGDEDGQQQLWYFSHFTKKADRLLAHAETLHDNIVQLMEIRQAVMDHRLNNIMKHFTVITSIFAPLTLVAGWYGMNFKYMPELSWEYGYLAAFILSLIVVLITIFIFKRKNLL